MNELIQEAQSGNKEAMATLVEENARINLEYC